MLGRALLGRTSTLWTTRTAWTCEPLEPWLLHLQQCSCSVRCRSCLASYVWSGRIVSDVCPCYLHCLPVRGAFTPGAGSCLSKPFVCLLVFVLVLCLVLQFRASLICALLPLGPGLQPGGRQRARQPGRVSAD